MEKGMEQTSSVSSGGQSDFKEKGKEQTGSESSVGHDESKEKGKEQTDSVSPGRQRDSTDIEKKQTDSTASGAQRGSTNIVKQQTDFKLSGKQTDSGLVSDFVVVEQQGKEQTDSKIYGGQEYITVIEKEHKDPASSGGQQNSTEIGKWNPLNSIRGLFGTGASTQPSNPMEVQFFVPINTATTKDFSNAIRDLFGDISFNCLLSGNLSENLPLVVVCPICSRFEPDIDCAIDGINWNKTFVVLLLHSGSKSSIPRIPTASKLAHMEKYKNIVFIDIAYTIGAKLYQCQMNEDAKVQLRRFFQDCTGQNVE